MSEDYNPKVHRAKKGVKKMSFDFADVHNPLALEIKDPEEILKTFKRWPLIPFAGTHQQSNHGLLYFLNSGKFISPTLGACHESIKSYAFGSKMDIGYIEDEDFDLGDSKADLSSDKKKEFRGFLKESLVLADNLSYTQLSENLYGSFKDNGNYFIELIHTETLGIKQSTVHYHPTDNCCYWATLKDQPKCIAISPLWGEQYLRDHPPSIIPLYPNYNLQKDGSKRTIIHVKNGNFNWYGRPDWIGSWMSVFREYQDADYLVKMAANQFTGQVFIELEDDDIENDDPWDSEGAIESGFDSVTDRIAENFTAKGKDPQSVMVSTRPAGANSAFIYQFKPVTNEKFFKVTSALARQKIIENNQWSERLLGNAVSEGFSSDAFISELKTKEVSVLRRYRNKISYGLNVVINEVIKFQGATQYESLGLVFKSTIEEMSEQQDLNI